MNEWLPLIFVFLMALSMLIYVVLDGYDLGVGILMRRASDADKDEMVASIGPFWDANETWLVLGVGILLVAFPVAHGVILGGLYVPVALMLAGLILRGVAFDFRVKAHDDHRIWWNRAFYFGSLLAALAQGFMLGIYLLGFDYSIGSLAFALFIALSLAAGYSLLGATWLILKTENALLRCAVGMFLLAFIIGLAYSLFPFLVVDRITYQQAATSPESLKFMLVGIVITLPAILGYTAYSYRVFWGKSRALTY